MNVSKFHFFQIGYLFGWYFEFSDTGLLAFSGFVDKIVHTVAQCSQFILLVIYFMFVVNSFSFQVNQPWKDFTVEWMQIMHVAIYNSLICMIIYIKC